MSSTIELKVTYDPQTRSYGDLKAEVIASFERQFVELTLNQFEGNLSAAAKTLKVDRKHLHDLCKKHGMR